MRAGVIGHGYFGKGCSYDLGFSEDVDDIVIGGPIRSEVENVAKEVEESTGTETNPAVVDAKEKENVTRFLETANVDFLINTVGPFYKYTHQIIEAAIETDTDYVDIMDDFDTAREIVCDDDYDQLAKESDVTVVCCCGASPGLTNLLAKKGYRNLENVTNIDIYWAYDFFLDSAAILDHFVHILGADGEIPEHINGEQQLVKPFGGRQTVEFLPPIQTVSTFFHGHPEPVTIPRYLDVRNVAIRGGFYQESIAELLEMLIKNGFFSEVEVTEADKSLRDINIEYMTSEAGQENIDMSQTNLPFAVRVDVRGSQNGEQKEISYLFNDSTRKSVTSPPSIVAQMIGRGEIDNSGVFSPEGCVNPDPILQQVAARIENFEFVEQSD